MNDEIRDPRFEPHHGVPARAPMGRYPVPDGAGLRTVECIHCAKPLGVSTWDYLNGFLVVCPHCRGFHGHPWGFERTLLAGLFLNVLGFFFVMRPVRAVAAIALFIAAAAVLIAVAAQNDTNAGPMIAALVVVVMGPVLVNAVALVRHQVRLDAAPPREDSRRLL